jgi:hypothetical protein
MAKYTKHGHNNVSELCVGLIYLCIYNSDIDVK